MDCARRVAMLSPMYVVLSASGPRSREHKVVEVSDLQAARPLLCAWEDEFARHGGTPTAFGAYHGMVFTESGRLDGMFAPTKRYVDATSPGFPAHLRKVTSTDARIDNGDAIAAKART